MAVIATLPRAVYPANTYLIPAILVPVGVTTIGAKLSRFAWPDTGGDVLKSSFMFSYDGGLTWPAGVGFTAVGGVLSYKGTPVDFSQITSPIGDPTNALRMVKGSVILLVALDTSVVIESL